MKYQRLKCLGAICLSMTMCFSNLPTGMMMVQQVQAQEANMLAEETTTAPTEDLGFLSKCDESLLITQTVTDEQAAEMLAVIQPVIKDAKSDYEKASLIQGWVNKNVTYAYNHENITAEPYQVFVNKRAVCGGFARLSKELMNLVGIPAVCVCGYYRGNNVNEGHEWNAVYVDGEWVYSDGVGAGLFNQSGMLKTHYVQEVVGATIESNGIHFGYYEGVAAVGTEEPTPEITIPDTVAGLPVSSISYKLFDTQNGIEIINMGANIDYIAEDSLNSSSRLKRITVSEDNQTYASKEGALFTKDYRRMIHFPKSSDLETFTLPAQTTSFDVKEGFCSRKLKNLYVEEGNTTYASYDGALYDANLTTLLFVPLNRTTVTVPVTAQIDDMAFANVDDKSKITIYGKKGSPAEQYVQMYQATGMKFVEVCEHNLVAVPRKDPTCTAEGNNAYWECSTCKAVYKDADGKETTTKQAETLAASEHNYGDWEKETPPTCTAAGKEKRTCTNSNCGNIETKDIPAAGHNYGEWTRVTDPTCTTAGKEKRICANSNCGDVETKDIPANGHSFGTEFVTDKEATCKTGGSKSKHCANCSETSEVTEIPVKEHKFDNGVITTEPTTTTEGIKTFTCSECKDTKTEKVPVKENTDNSGNTGNTDNTGNGSNTGNTDNTGNGSNAGNTDNTGNGGNNTGNTDNTGNGSNTDNTDNVGSSDDKDNTTNKEEQTAPAKGTKLLANGYTYKVTKSALKGGTVTLVKAKNNAKTIKVPATIKVKNITYKVTAIEKNAFKNQKKVTQITIGSNVAKLGTTMFTNCKKLKTITIASTKLTKNNVAKNAFKGLGKNTTIKVPKKKVAAYKTIFKSKGLNAKVKVK